MLSPRTCPGPEAPFWDTDWTRPRASDAFPVPDKPAVLRSVVPSLVPAPLSLPSLSLSLSPPPLSISLSSFPYLPPVRRSPERWPPSPFQRPRLTLSSHWLRAERLPSERSGVAGSLSNAGRASGRRRRHRHRVRAACGTALVPPAARGQLLVICTGTPSFIK